MDREGTRSLFGATAAEFREAYPDHFTERTPRQTVQDALRASFHELGGAAWLKKFAESNDSNARTYVQLLGKLIPMEIVGKNGEALTILIKSYSNEPDAILKPDSHGLLHNVIEHLANKDVEDATPSAPEHADT